MDVIQMVSEALIATADLSPRHQATALAILARVTAAPECATTTKTAFLKKKIERLEHRVRGWESAAHGQRQYYGDSGDDTHESIDMEIARRRDKEYYEWLKLHLKC